MQQKHIFLLQIWVPKGAPMLVHSSPMNSRKRIGSWHNVHFCNIFQLPLWHHWLGQNGSTPDKTMIFNTLDHQSTLKCYVYICYSTSINRTSNVSLPGIHFQYCVSLCFLTHCHPHLIRHSLLTVNHCKSKIYATLPIVLIIMHLTSGKTCHKMSDYML